MHTYAAFFLPVPNSQCILVLLSVMPRSIFLFTNESHVWFVPHLTLPNFGHAQIMGIAKIVGNILLDYSLTKI
jgi:hypothetical protein